MWAPESYWKRLEPVTSVTGCLRDCTEQSVSNVFICVCPAVAVHAGTTAGPAVQLTLGGLEGLPPPGGREQVSPVEKSFKMTGF